jgi:hypothetical protein
MDLKLKDKIILLLIENPGMSIIEVSKNTNNYYSYIHKLITNMEKSGEVHINKIKENNKIITKVFLNEEYKNNWIFNFKKIMKSILKNIEIKISFILMYFALNYNYFNNYFNKRNTFASASYDQVILTEKLIVDDVNSTSVAPNLNIDFYLILLIIIPLLIIIWYLRKNKKK